MDRQISEGEMKIVLKRDKNHCRYCGSTKGPFEFDHVYPYSKGGETSINNIVTACKKCNRSKHDKVGIWPKPVDYFNLVKQKDKDIIDISIFSLGLALVGNGFLNILDPIPGFLYLGKWSMILGIIVFSFGLVKLSLGR